MPTIAETLATALAEHRAGRLQAAEQIYRHILQIDPHQADAWHLLGVIAFQVGKHELAVEHIERAVQLNGGRAAFHHHLGDAQGALGRLVDAVNSYQRALQLEPDLLETHHNLGLAYHRQGRLPEAIACYRRALELQPGNPEIQNTLQKALAHCENKQGIVFAKKGQLEEAAACFQKALVLDPQLVDAPSNLGLALKRLGRRDEAVACFRQAFRLDPGDAGGRYNLGLAFKELGQGEEAAECFRQALRLNPDHAPAHNGLGRALMEQGRRPEAVIHFRQAVRLNPQFADALNNLGLALKEEGELELGTACYQEALRLNPDHAEAHYNLGSAFLEQGLLDEAVTSFQQALRVKPGMVQAYNNLGNAWRDQGELDKAITCYQRAGEFQPDFIAAHSNLLYTLIFSPRYDARTILEAHRRWDQQHAEPLAKEIQPHANEPSPERRLKLGYVSPDLRFHPVGRFLLPLLEAHDPAGFEIFCYASVRTPDGITDRCRARADVWRDVADLDDEQLARVIRQDRIDVLVDLTMHMAGSRLLVFARKPAPVQVTYLAYCGTTGLRAMDYRLTDPYLDPPGRDEGCYSERSVVLPETYWCYEPVREAGPLGPLPALKAGHVTFGCLNNFCKVAAPTLEAWGLLLRTLPTARLLLSANPGSHRGRVRELFAKRGVSPERLLFVDRVPIAEYFQLFHRIDVALDPFPYAGGTTTCDALWMGIPVVSLAGEQAVGRAGLSILSNVGLPELVAHDVENHVQIAVELAQDLPRLKELRTVLRERMRASPLMDAPRFARSVEAAYRAMWRHWCAEGAPLGKV